MGRVAGGIHILSAEGEAAKRHDQSGKREGMQSELHPVAGVEGRVHLLDGTCRVDGR
jgi:hypothetical protein